MELWLLDSNFVSVGVIDGYKSLIWTERYSSYGDFELYAPAEEVLLNMIKIDYYVWIANSDMVMIIDSIQITTDVENGNHLIITGRSLESILERRIVWDSIRFTNKKLQEAIAQLINDSIIDPTISERKIANFEFASSNDETIDGLKLSAQYTGDNLYEVIKDICDANDLGFRIQLIDNALTFSLYRGVDRSYDQNERAYVVFSPGYENLVSSNYLRSRLEYKNVALIAGEDSGTNRRTLTLGNASGIDRRELYVDARDIQSETESGSTISDTQYDSLLNTRGSKKLLEYKEEFLLEGSIYADSPFSYGKDFNKGDVVQVINEYNMEFKVRILEYVRCLDESGYNTYPTFEIINDEEEEG